MESVLKGIGICFGIAMGMDFIYEKEAREIRTNKIDSNNRI